MVTEFLDVYMLFPILLLGIDKMIKEKKYLLYIISLILIIASNYYFSYMVCIFAFLYFNYRLVIERKKIDYKLIIKENKNFIIIFLSIIIFPGLPDDLLCYIAGISKMKFQTFLLIILIGKPISLLMYSIFINIL
jgi:uncharacterized membrane protein YfhO